MGKIGGWLHRRPAIRALDKAVSGVIKVRGMPTTGMRARTRIDQAVRTPAAGGRNAGVPECDW